MVLLQISQSFLNYTKLNNQKNLWLYFNDNKIVLYL